MNPFDEPWTGKTLSNGRYRVLRKIDKGGMAAVYLAHDAHLKTDVVIKFPLDEMLKEPNFVRRFSREIRSLVELSHPNVVRILDTAEERGVPFAVMQFLPGGSLLQRQMREGPGGKKGPMRMETLASWLGPVASALDFIHERGFLHRDVKPGNILFDSAGNAYLSDFGLTKVLNDTRPREERTAFTAEGAILGTPHYMAPELLVGGGQVSGRTDQYALAATVYEWLTGQFLFGETPPTLVLVKQVKEVPRDPSELVASLPTHASRSIMRALSKELGTRFTTCIDFCKAVMGSQVNAEQTIAESFHAGIAPLRVSSTTVSEPERRTGSAGPPADTEAERTIDGGNLETPVRRPGKRVVVGAAALIGVVVLAATSFFLMNRGNSHDKVPAEITRDTGILILESKAPLASCPVRPKNVNGFSFPGQIDCTKAAHQIEIGKGFDIAKSWAVSFECLIPDFGDEPRQIFFWGDDRGGFDPIYVCQEGKYLKASIMDCKTNTGLALQAELLGLVPPQWLNVTVCYRQESKEMELYLDRRLMRKEVSLVAPSVDRLMPGWLGGTNATDQRFKSELKGIWLSNIGLVEVLKKD